VIFREVPAVEPIDAPCPLINVLFSTKILKQSDLIAMQSSPFDILKSELERNTRMISEERRFERGVVDMDVRGEPWINAICIGTRSIRHYCQVVNGHEVNRVWNNVEIRSFI